MMFFHRYSRTGDCSLLRFWVAEKGAVAIEFVIAFPVFASLLLFTFEFTRYVFARVQLESILVETAWQSRTGLRQDVEANAREMAESGGFPLLDPSRLEMSVKSADTVTDIVMAPRPGLGGPNDVVRYEMTYDYMFFGGLGLKAWDPVPLRFVQVNRNELQLD